MTLFIVAMVALGAVVFPCLIAIVLLPQGGDRRY